MFTRLQNLIALGTVVSCQCLCTCLACAEQPSPATVPGRQEASSKNEELPSQTKLTVMQKWRLLQAHFLTEQSLKLSEQSKYKEAIEPAKQAIAIREEILGKSHADYAGSLHNLAELYRRLGDYANAEPLFQTALLTLKNTQGENNLDYAAGLVNLAMLYQSTQELPKAEQLLRQALTIRKKLLGESNLLYAGTLQQLASHCMGMGKLAESEELYQQRKTILREIYGEDHSEYAKCLNDLAVLYDALQDFAKAEPLYRQALKIHEKAEGKLSAHYSATLSNLAALYHGMGDFRNAESLLKEACSIRKEQKGERSLGYLNSRNNLAVLYYDQKRYSDAEIIQEQNITILKDLVGEEHEKYVFSLCSLAECQRAMGEYSKAERRLDEVLVLARRTSREKHPFYATALINLAELKLDTGHFRTAEGLLHEAIAIRKNVLGERHPLYAHAIAKLAQLYINSERPIKAVPLAHQALLTIRRQLELTAAIQSGRQQLQMANKLRPFLFNYLSGVVEAKTPAEKVYAEVLAWKGMVSRRQHSMRQRRSERKQEVADLYAELETTARLFENMSRSSPGVEQDNEYPQRLNELRDELEHLQQQLASISSDFRRELGPHDRTPAELQRVLTQDVAMVDLLEYTHFVAPGRKSNTSAEEQRLLAFIITLQRPIELIDLGPSEAIAIAIDRWRTSYSSSDAAEVHRLVWAPLEAKVAGAKTIIVSPDGALTRFPFAALPGKQAGSYLIEEVALATIAIPTLLPDLLATKLASAEPSLLAVGDIDFGTALGANGPTERYAYPARTSRNSGISQFAQLAGSKPEMLAIASLFHKCFPEGRRTILSQSEPTKPAVCAAMPRSTYLHFATHGFFQSSDDQFTSASSDTRNENDSAELHNARTVYREYPDLLVGLALAGANQEAENGHDDGILTALAVAELDLSSVQLATLSACETGLGELAHGEGLLGLQRAFQLAGSRTTLASLWRVHDDATRALMTEFYINLWKKKLSRVESLRQAQLAMLYHYSLPEGVLRGPGENVPADKDKLAKARKDGDRQAVKLSPKYWAAFILSGDWR